MASGNYNLGLFMAATDCLLFLLFTFLFMLGFASQQLAIMWPFLPHLLHTLSLYGLVLAPLKFMISKSHIVGIIIIIIRKSFSLICCGSFPPWFSSLLWWIPQRLSFSEIAFHQLLQLCHFSSEMFKGGFELFRFLIMCNLFFLLIITCHYK